MLRCSGYLVYWALFGLSQFFQVVRGDTPTAAGVLLLPLIVPQVVVSGVSGFIVSKVSTSISNSSSWLTMRADRSLQRDYRSRLGRKSSVHTAASIQLGLILGSQLYAVAIGVLSIIDEHSSKGMIVGLLIFTAIGAGQTFQTGEPPSFHCPHSHLSQID